MTDKISRKKKLVLKGAKKIVPTCIVVLGALSVMSAYAKPPHRGKPPQEAFDACVDRTEGESVSFETPRGDTLDAVCRFIDDELVAVPADREKRKRRSEEN